MIDNAKNFYTIDAAGVPLGRTASRAAAMLRGKATADFERQVLPRAKVKIVNAAQVKITGDKLRGKSFARYSGYPGGLRHETLGNMATRRGWAEVFRQTIKGMLPSNKLRAQMLRNLTIEN